MMNRLLSPLAIMLLAATLLAASVDTADARKGRRGAFAAGVAAGIIGLSILGAHADHYDEYEYVDGPECYKGPRECRWVEGGCYYDSYGDRICSEGYKECRRPVYCD